MLLRPDGAFRLTDHTMVALALLVAESEPSQKDLMIRLVLSLLEDWAMKMKDPRCTPFNRMKPEELHEATKAFDEEMVVDRSRPVTAAERRAWEEARRKPGRPRRGAGAKVISVSVERGLLARSDALAKELGVSRAGPSGQASQRKPSGRKGSRWQVRSSARPACCGVAAVVACSGRRLEQGRQRRLFGRAVAGHERHGRAKDEETAGALELPVRRGPRACQVSRASAQLDLGCPVVGGHSGSRGGCPWRPQRQ